MSSNTITVLKLSIFTVFCTDKTCPAPETPKNAIAVGNNTVGSSVRFLCKEGFFRLGRPFTVTCQSNGQWTKPNVSCVGEGGKICSQIKYCLFVANSFACFIYLFVCLLVSLSLCLSLCLFAYFFVSFNLY